MVNHPNRSKIIHLESITEADAGPELLQRMLRAHELRNVADRIKIEQVGEIRHAGQRYWINAPRLTIVEEADRFDRFSPTHENEVIAHAIKQIVKIKNADRKFVQVEVRSNNISDDGNSSEWEAHVYWNHRKQYEQIYFSLNY